MISFRQKRLLLDSNSQSSELLLNNHAAWAIIRPLKFLFNKLQSLGSYRRSSNWSWEKRAFILIGSSGCMRNGICQDCFFASWLSCFSSSKKDPHLEWPRILIIWSKLNGFSQTSSRTLSRCNSHSFSIRHTHPFTHMDTLAHTHALKNCNSSVILVSFLISFHFCYFYLFCTFSLSLSLSLVLAFFIIVKFYFP